MTKTSDLDQSQLVPISEPNMDDNFSSLKQEIFATLNCHRVGTIESFDPTTQTATIQLVDAWTQNNYQGNFSQPIAPLIKCPIVILKGAKGGFTSPINKGDQCLVLFNDRDLDNWQKAGGEYQIPATARCHYITDAFAIVGIRSLANPIEDFNNVATEMNYQDTVISLDEKVKIQNATKNLKTLIDNLITAIVNLQILDPISGPLPITSATVTALNAAKTDFDALLK